MPRRCGPATLAGRFAPIIRCVKFEIGFFGIVMSLWKPKDYHGHADRSSRWWDDFLLSRKSGCEAIPRTALDPGIFTSLDITTANDRL
jgi:hypothetical protein